MRFGFLFILLLAVSASAAASPAVETINYEVNGSATQGSVGNVADATSSRIGGRVTLPVGRYIGASLSADYSRGQFSPKKIFADSGSCDTDYRNLTGKLFARTAAARIGVSYSWGNEGVCMFFPGGTSTDSADFTSNTINVAYYWEPLTLGFSRSHTDIDGAPHSSDSSNVHSTWYPGMNLSLRLSVEKSDATDGRPYLLTAEYQPAALGNSTGLSLGYASNTRESDRHSVTVGVSYFFDKRVDLKTRDRRYR